MNWIQRMLLQGMLLKMDGEPGAGGGAPGAGTPPAPEAGLDALKKQNEDLLKRLEALEGKKPPVPPVDPEKGDLAAAAKKKREDEEKAKNSEAAMTSAINFTVKAPEWLKTNAPLLPKTVAGLFEAAEKENYGTAVEKANAIKAGIVQEFFAIQTNLDLLTDSQKILVEDFKKLTHADKRDRVADVYASIFEPTFEQLRRLEKAKQVRSGEHSPSDTEATYNRKMKELSQKHYLGEKKNA